MSVSNEKKWWDIFKSEIVHHFPYGTLSVACAIMLLSFINVFFPHGIAESVHQCSGYDHNHVASSGMDILFHTFHFIHIIFAASGAMLMYYRYTKKNSWKGVMIGVFTSFGFCTLSDILLPYVAGLMMGVKMNLHICFVSELQNIIPFLFIGILNGLAIVKIHEKNQESVSLQLHFFHTFISAMASIFYAVGNGLASYDQNLGAFFLLMLIAVVLPCTLSDVVAPLFFARVLNNEKVVISGLSKSFGKEPVFSNLNLDIPAGTFFALLGPSGCGKTTLLRILAGFEEPDAGVVYVGNDNIMDLPANKRSVNTVFQNYALFPHLNVFENVAYSLRAKGFAEAVIQEKVMRFLVMMDLKEQAQRKIQQLSGGQQQRVAIARAIINEPSVLLLDEPLSALDVRLREKVLVELIDLQSKLGTTFIYITHDQNEALTVADQMAIMSKEGGIEQVGKPKEIYEFPKTLFVATFVGETNIISGNLIQQDGIDFIQSQNELLVAVVISPQDRKNNLENQQMHLSIRPEKIKISKKELDGYSNKLAGRVEAIVYYGRSTQYKVDIGNGVTMQVVEQNQDHFEKVVIDYDDLVYLYWQKENGVLLSK